MVSRRGHRPRRAQSADRFLGDRQFRQKRKDAPDRREQNRKVKLPVNRPLVYLITAGTATDENIETTRLEIIATVALAVDLGIPLIQLREKRLSAKNLYQMTLDLVEVTGNTGTLLLVNDRADVAAAAGADGVHLTSSSMSVGRVRAVFGSEMLIGASTHCIADVERAASNGADLVVIGPVFESPDKPDLLGLDAVRSITDQIGAFPVLGLGGIEDANWRQVVDAGCAGFAAIRSLNDPDSMRRIMKSI